MAKSLLNSFGQIGTLKPIWVMGWDGMGWDGIPEPPDYKSTAWAVLKSSYLKRKQPCFDNLQTSTIPSNGKYLIDGWIKGFFQENIARGKMYL